MDDQHEAPTPDSARRALMLGGAVAAAGAISSASAQTSRPLKIVLHVSEADAWPAALSNARNLSAKYPGVKVRVISDGSGVYGYQGSNALITEMAATSKAGVEYQACNNALDEKKIPPSSLAPFVKVVPAGVIALAEAEGEGFAYIKP